MKTLSVVSAVLLALLFSTPSYSQDADYLSQGITDYKDESYEEAFESLSKARSLDGKSAKAAYYLGLTNKRLQNFKEAKANLKDALSLDPFMNEAHYELAEVLYYLDETDEAAKEIEAAGGAGLPAGDVAFLRGLILAKAGKNEEAVNSFKTAKAKDGRLTQSADYQIGVIYIKENRLAEAKEAFNQVVIKDPASDLAMYADEYGKSIEKKQDRERPFKLTAGLRYEYDNNVVLKPADSAAANGVTNEDDRREVFTLRSDYDKKLQGPWSIKTQYSLYLTNQHHLETHDIQSHTINIIPGHSHKEHATNVLFGYNYTLVDDSRYLQTMTFSPSHNHTLSPTQLATVSFKLQRKEFLSEPFNTNEDRDSVDMGLGVGYFSFFTGSGGFFNLRYELNREVADGKNWSYRGNKFIANILYPIGDDWRVQAYFDAYLQNYENTHTVFGKARIDRVYTQSVLVAYEVMKKVELVFQYTHVRDDSNIATYDYDRDIVSGGFEIRM